MNKQQNPQARTNSSNPDTINPELPVVYVASQDKKHRLEIDHAIKQYFKVDVFDDMKRAADVLLTAPPQVMLVEVDDKGHIDDLRKSLPHLSGTPPAFIFLSKSGNGFKGLLKQFGKNARFLTWPLYSSSLIGSIRELLNQAAEKSWEALAPAESKILKVSITQYQKLADSVRNESTIDFKALSNSCAPLVGAIDGELHHNILKDVQSHHDYTYVHSMRVATLLTLFGQGVGLKGNDLKVLATGGLAHDIGKLKIPLSLLDKTDKLTAEEWVVMRDHARQSALILGGNDDVTKGARLIAAQHHEMLDGSGYPHALKGKQINELARMAAIADIFGALSDVRSYKPALGVADSFAILEGMKTAIDQPLLSMFKEIFISTRPS